jgi:hypothetical protein
VAQSLGLILTWITSRLWVFFLLWLLPFIPYDVELYEQWSNQFLSGSFPLNDVLWQYPDGVSFVLLIPQLSPIGYLPSFVFFALFIDFLAFLVLFKWQSRNNGASWGLWLWATAGFWVGPTLLTRLDVFVAVTAILALVSQRTWIQGVFAGLGFSLKVWPILTVFNAPRRNLLQWVLIFLATVLGTFTIARILFPSGDSFLFNQSGRGLHGESVVALPYLLAPNLLNSSGLVEQSGTLEITGNGAAQVGLIATLIGLVLVALLFVARLRNRLPHMSGTDLVVIALLITVVFGRVFSPQFYVWLAAVGAVALTVSGSRLKGPMILVIASGVTAQYVYPLNMGWGELEPDAVIAQTVRIVLLCGALIWSLIRVHAESPSGTTTNDRLGS